MGLLSIFKRRTESSAAPSAAASDPADEVQRARSRARQRLIGAVVLVGIGVIGFPLVFETQPRPIPVDIPIEIPRKEGAPPLAMPPARAPAATASAAQARAASSGAADDGVITESRSQAGRDVAAAAPSAPSAPPRATAKAEPAAPPPPVARQAAKPEPDAKPDRDARTAGDPKPASERRPAADAARARALLDGKAPAATDSARFVVQVGAFADAAAARETRQKVEKLGLKTYTQVASTPSGNRIRVRAGPFATRAEADKALAKARSAGLGGVVLTL